MWLPDDLKASDTGPIFVTLSSKLHKKKKLLDAHARSFDRKYTLAHTNVSYTAT